MKATAFDALRGALAPQLAQARTRWQALAPRERRLMALAAAAVALLLVWMVGVQPALRTLRTVPLQRAEVDRQWAQMQALALEARELRTLPPVSAEQAEAALRAATTRLGAIARLQLAGDRATVTLNGIDGGTLAGWLGEVRSGARARVIELQLARQGQTYQGQVVLALGRPA